MPPSSLSGQSGARRHQQHHGQSDLRPACAQQGPVTTGLCIGWLGPASGGTEHVAPSEDALTRWSSPPLLISTWLPSPLSLSASFLPGGWNRVYFCPLALYRVPAGLADQPTCETLRDILPRLCLPVLCLSCCPQQRPHGASLTSAGGGGVLFAVLLLKFEKHTTYAVLWAVAKVKRASGRGHVPPTQPCHARALWLGAGCGLSDAGTSPPATGHQCLCSYFLQQGSGEQ